MKSEQSQAEPITKGITQRDEQPGSMVMDGRDVASQPSSTDVLHQPEVFCHDEDDWSDWEDENRNMNDDWSNSSHDHIVVSNQHIDTLPEIQHSFYTEDKGPDLWSLDSGVQSNNGIISDDSASVMAVADSNSQQKKVGMSLKGKVKSIKPKQNKPLGSEFDIHSVEIKVKEQKEVDFFADMIPDIKPTSDMLTSVDSQKTQTVKENSSLFAYNTADFETKVAKCYIIYLD